MNENPDHFNVLRKIQNKPNSTQRELAEELGFTHKDFYDSMSINNDITIDTKVSRNGA